MQCLLALWPVLCLGFSGRVSRERGISCWTLNTDDRLPTSVTVVDASNGSVLTVLPVPAVHELGFSPRGSFVSTWERPAKDEEGNATKNLKIWRVVDPQNDTANAGDREGKEPVGSFVQRSQSGWNLQYTGDERYCARAVTNEVQFYESNDLRTVWNKLRAEGVSDFTLSPGDKHSVAVFIPERKVCTYLRGSAIALAKLTLQPGTTGRCEGLRCASLRLASLSKDFL